MSELLVILSIAALCNQTGYEGTHKHSTGKNVLKCQQEYIKCVKLGTDLGDCVLKKEYKTLSIGK